MIDVTDLNGKVVQTGDEVVLFGEQQADGRIAALPVDEMADWLDTINYEVTCLIAARAARL